MTAQPTRRDTPGTTPEATSGTTPAAATRAYRRAWLVLMLYPVSFAAAFGVGEGLAAALGYPPGGADTAPGWVMVVATVPALLVFAVPGVLAVLLARRAARTGRPRAMLPGYLGAGIAVLFALQNLAAYLLGG